MTDDTLKAEVERRMPSITVAGKEFVGKDEAVAVAVEIAEKVSAYEKRIWSEMLTESVLAETKRCEKAIDASWPGAKGLVKHAIDAIRKPPTKMCGHAEKGLTCGDECPSDEPPCPEHAPPDCGYCGNPPRHHCYLNSAPPAPPDIALRCHYDKNAKVTRDFADMLGPVMEMTSIKPPREEPPDDKIRDMRKRAFPKLSREERCPKCNSDNRQVAFLDCSDPYRSPWHTQPKEPADD